MPSGRSKLARSPDPSRKSALNVVWFHRYEDSAGSRELLLVIQMNVVRGHVGKIVWREIELRRIEILALGALVGEIQIGVETRPARNWR